MDFVWADPHPEIQKMCVLFERTELSSPEKWYYKSLQSYLQEGPQCGLVALAMLTGVVDKTKIDAIFNCAKENGFTFNGEMFSVEFMAQLAHIFLNKCDIEVFTGNIDCNQVKKCLLEGGSLLVPYDTNKDNSPGLHNGHKAHWCVVSGGIQTSSDFFVIVRHGKAKNIAIWNIKSLAVSNQQLYEFSPDRKLQDTKYLLPKGGIAGPLGLNNKCVMIHPKYV